jgi:hypothetical protein
MSRSPMMNAEGAPEIPDDWIGDRTVAEIARDELGIEIRLLRARFEKSGWKYLGESNDHCPDCGFALHAARKPYVPTYKGELRLARYWAFICANCATTFDPAALGERVKEVQGSMSSPTRSPVSGRGVDSRPFVCPVCGGTGDVAAGFYREDSTQTSCRSCSGTGVVWSTD